jgi:alkanesulfonate monooxygenase SsuD/methylene tetrahydromethanopterin reductase-like flavin-dependent oxidoreductase (luciferase family)
VQAAWCNPKPVQKPHPPIMIGGGGERVLLRIVATHADRWNFGGSVADFRQKLPLLEAHCRAIGRDPAAIEKSWFGNVIIEANEERLQRRLAKRAARSGAAADQLDRQMIVGTPDGVIERIKEYVALGVTHFIAMFGRVDRLESTELFGRAVIPAFR